MTREIETWLSDSRVGNSNVWVEILINSGGRRVPSMAPPHGSH